jgi:hypothetical protein
MQQSRNTIAQALKIFPMIRIPFKRVGSFNPEQIESGSDSPASALMTFAT